MTDDRDYKGEPYSSKGHLTVQRSIYAASTRLVEVWVLDYLAWADQNDAGSYDIVKVYLADVNNVNQHGIPRQDKRVEDTMSWDELPDDVRREFCKQVANIREAVEALNEQAEPEI